MISSAIAEGSENSFGIKYKPKSKFKHGGQPPRIGRNRMQL
jgi:hypothetical protein